MILREKLFHFRSGINTSIYGSGISINEQSGTAGDEEAAT